MAFLAGATLVWPGTTFNLVWMLNPRAYTKLVPLGRAVGIPFLLLGLTLAIAAVGWFKRRVWGWWLAVVLIATQVLGDVINIFMGHFVMGGIGVAIAGALLWYLFRENVKAVFKAGKFVSKDSTVP